MSTADAIPYMNEFSQPTSKIEWVEHMPAKDKPNYFGKCEKLRLDLSSVLLKNIEFPTSSYARLDIDEEFVIPFAPNRRFTINAKIVHIRRWTPKVTD